MNFLGGNELTLSRTVENHIPKGYGSSVPLPGKLPGKELMDIFTFIKGYNY